MSFQLRYYLSEKDLELKSQNFESVGIYGNRGLAFGVKKRKAVEPNYKESLLKVVKT